MSMTTFKPQLFIFLYFLGIEKHVQVTSFQLSPLVHKFTIHRPSASITSASTASASTATSTSLNGKLWDKLEIEPDPLDEEAGWYLMNCIVGSEMDLLAQAKHVTKDFPTELIEKLVVPTERKLRSHGKSQNVVEVKVMYPGYVFCKMRICAETYEPLQQLPLCRSWMAGTVNQKGYKKLPPAPIALSDDEVAKFKGLEEQTDAMYEKFGEDYTGRGDDGMDLIDQYEGYRVESMVKILSGNFKGEDGVVRRLKDGQIMVRLYTYGNVMDQWFKPNEIRTMTDAEAMKGLTGPTTPILQDEFDVSIGKKPRSQGLRSDLSRSTRLGGLGGGGRNRRQDRVNRGETGERDLFGRSSQEMAEEEENWRQFREEQRASQQQKRGDMWGIKERTSWDGGDDAAQFEGGKWKSGRQMRREKKQKDSSSGDNASLNKSVQDAIDGGGEWDFFADSSSNHDNDDADEGDGAEDDFFNSLMSELSDTLEDTSPSPSSRDNNSSKQVHEKKNKPSKNNNDAAASDDDFFNDLMSQLSETVDKSPPSHNRGGSKNSNSMESAFSDDDFFSNLEADLNESLKMDDSEKEETFSHDDANEFFANGNAFDKSPQQDTIDEDDFFASLESQLGEALTEEKPVVDDDKKKKVATKVAAPIDFNQQTVAALKDMLREQGLKVSGKKAELIQRLKEHQEA
eukprot:CAMPEP_0203665486 /NCGR_PEP_ID=MMETSP0090-20130426/2694_1 /ASSEMBLY_ACC=CAM_ASM_001088 /TAXON_ID=426623 /ORGANISM="Chaetoceros affinis, Strain CCMP159" /LENGTH=682 /DNA_ID=CAMNT_0050529057 /DNA_START=94 /DNA_END=2142 /DNA_ORIENTATION=+